MASTGTEFSAIAGDSRARCAGIGTLLRPSIGIDFAVVSFVLHLVRGGPEAPRLPERRPSELGRIAAISAIAHVAGAIAMTLFMGPPEITSRGRITLEKDPCLDSVSHVVFLTVPRPPGAGGGGGGNRSQEPIRRAEGIGRDPITLRTRRTTPAASAAISSHEPDPVITVPSIVLDALPLASSSVEQLGLPSADVHVGASMGPGSGGGVGSGTGLGIGAGEGPGLGRGSGGGTGGGVYRAGGAVSAPRVLVQVNPKYTNSAVVRHIQGTVEMELVVRRDGRPSQIRIVRSLDPGGLDDEAVAAVTQWRFDPGRLAGVPVDVFVVVLLDFWIR